MKVVVVGGGPAGLFAAAEASRYAEVIILEKNDQPGKKLLLTGSGQCNLTHDCSPDEMVRHFYGTGRFLRTALHRFSPQNAIHFFEQQGVLCMKEPNGKVFPRSRKAGDVLSALMKLCSSRKVKIQANSKVCSITKTGSGFTITCADDQRYSADRVVLALGGTSYPSTGSAGDGYLLASGMGHRIITPRPALCAVRVTPHPLKELSGLSFSQAEITVYRGERKILSHHDDLLITSRGFSGPVILDRSGSMMQGDTLEIDFSGKGGGFLQELLEMQKTGGALQFSTLFTRLGLQKRLVQLQLGLHSGADRKAAEISKKDITAASYLFTNARFTISEDLQFSSAMLTAGGVDTREVNPSTMESRIVPGFFFAGEILDIQGDTGGFNLQAAWSTGYLAGAQLCFPC